ncbi:hypothetical protein ACWF0M_12760 [Kribbella sp. NPDC055110]
MSSKNFEKVRAQVDPGGDLYVMYRTLSADAHAGEPIVHRWVGESGDPHVLGWRPTPDDLQPAERAILANTLALSLLWAAAGFDQMVKGRPLDRTVNAVSAKLGSLAWECTNWYFRRVGNRAANRLRRPTVWTCYSD